MTGKRSLPPEYILCINGMVTPHPLLQSLDQYYGPKKSSHAFQVAPLINRLKSRGFIKLRSTDPYENPIIDPLYFSHPQDIDVAVAGKIGFGIKQSEAFVDHIVHTYVLLKITS